jgi:ADP-ribosylglycohydrolase
MNLRYLDPLERLEFELIQRREEGSDTAAPAATFQTLAGLPLPEARVAARRLLGELAASRSAESPDEPEALAAIRAAAPRPIAPGSGARPLPDAALHDKILGGWLGRAAGCLLGKPVERHPRAALREMLQSGGHWPLDHYWTEQGMPADILLRYPWKQRLGRESLRENIACMPEDDDMNYPMLNLLVLETCGPGFRSRDVGEAWLKHLPALQVFTAERVAYFNLLDGREPPESATHLNPFREWIGAQIRADLWGYASPGHPAQAAEFAWRDASLSHTRNGKYSAMFFAALIATAFVESDPRRLIEAALGHIPARSRLSQAIRHVLDLPVAAMEWEAVLDALEARFGHYHWVHSLNNTALVVAALLSGAGDYEKTICRTVMGGWDTDSNGATAGSIVGVIRGAGALPAKWIAPLDDRIRSSLGGFDHARFSDLARRTHALARSSVPPPHSAPASRADDF